MREEKTWGHVLERYRENREQDIRCSEKDIGGRWERYRMDERVIEERKKGQDGGGERGRWSGRGEGESECGGARGNKCGGEREG